MSNCAVVLRWDDHLGSCSDEWWLKVATGLVCHSRSKGNTAWLVSLNDRLQRVASCYV